MGCLKRGEKEQVLTIFEHFYNTSQRSGRLPTTQRLLSGQKWIQRCLDAEPRGAVPTPCPARACPVPADTRTAPGALLPAVRDS